ncbi:MAG TPA: transcriptional repressor [Kofleriaceae bacterium]|jgi:Fur family ferric uptake transcriptional regulator|nr:transcriptional repressor [Kofleriaceae bacterium]
MSRGSTLEALRAQLRDRGLRATVARVAVLEILHASAQPISHAEVTARLAELGCDSTTLYRNLIDLVEAKLARRADVGDHVWRFALVHDEHDAAAHPHFVCTECGSIQCLPTMQVRIPTTKAPRAVKRKQIEIHVRGLCDACA